LYCSSVSDHSNSIAGLGTQSESAHSSAASQNAHNPIVALPVEILHAIFVFCVGDLSSFDSIRHKYPPSWIAITYVCQRWRIVTLDFMKLWSSITQDLSTQWIAAFLQRSSYAPTYVDICVGPPPQKPPKDRRFAMRRRRVQKPWATLYSEVVEEVLSHTSRVEDLHLEGNTKDVVRILTSLEESIPLISLSLASWDGCTYLPVERGDEENQVNTSFILPENFLGGKAPRFRRLQCRESLHVTFPSWVLGMISEFSVSYFYCPKRLFAIIRQMPQLEILRILSRNAYESSPNPDFIMPVHLNNLSLLVFDGNHVGLLVALLGSLSTTSGVRKHIRLDLDWPNFVDPLWERFTSLICSKTAIPSDPLHGIHFRREPSKTSIRVWASPEYRFPPSPWPPQDDSFSLEIQGTERGCLNGLYTSYSRSVCDRLQEFCVSLARGTIHELFVEYGGGPVSYRRPFISSHCWRPLLSGLSSIKTLHFGDGAADLLIGVWRGTLINPSSTADGVLSSILSSDLKQVIISGGAFSTRVLWNWINYYAFDLPAGADVSDLTTKALALLAPTRRKPTCLGFEEDLTGGFITFLLHCMSTGVHISEVLLVNTAWDGPGGLELLQRLLHIFYPDLNAILQ
jgi:F-box-like